MTSFPLIPRPFSQGNAIRRRVPCTAMLIAAVIGFAAAHAHAETLVGRFGWTGSAWTVDATNTNNAGFNNPGTNTGDLALNTGGSPLQFASGFTMAMLAENDPTGTITVDNILAPFPDATTADLFISEVDNSGTEESSPLSAALFPYADGWSGAAFQANGTRVNGDTGISVSKTATGTYSVTGVPTTGNVVAIATGNGATNVASVTHTGSGWEVLTIGDGGTAADADFQMMHIPTAATGIATGVVDWDTLSVTGLNTGTTGQIAADATSGYMQLQVNGGALAPSNSLLFLWAEGADATSIDNIYSTDYDPGSASNGNDWWEIAGVDLPNATTAQQSDFRFLVVPLDTALVAVPEPTMITAMVAGCVSLTVGVQFHHRRRRAAHPGTVSGNGVRHGTCSSREHRRT